VDHLVTLPELFEPGMRKLAFVDGQQILIFNIGGALFAVDNTCPHAGASLYSGKLHGKVLQCPVHAMRFDVTTGCFAGGDRQELQTYPVVWSDGSAVLTL
jgi:3-phenylpropionate/trans-cinnamate dioxygenase ferredoxin component